MRQKVFITLTIIVCFVLQSTLFTRIQFGGVSPNLLIVITAAFGFMCGQKCGLTVGFFSGLLYDIFFGEVLCFYALIFMYIGFLNGSFKQLFFEDDIKLPILLIVSSDLVYGMICYTLLFLLRGRFHFTHYFTRIILPEVVYTVVITIFLYPLILKINSRLEGPTGKNEDIYI